MHIFEDVHKKLYEWDVQKISYLVVPLQSTEVDLSSIPLSIEDVVDMSQIRRVCEQPTWQWTSETPEQELLDKYIADPMNGGRRFYSERVAHHLKPQEPLPADIPRQNQKFTDSILDYSDSRWKRIRDIDRWHRDQPVLEVEKIPFRRNILARAEDKELEVLRDLRTVICPEPTRISNLATLFVVMCYILPANIHRFESYLIAFEACKHIDLEVSPALTLEALTKDPDNSGERGEGKINFKNGMGSNYERLEFLGNCFLKMATSISTFVQQPDENEFEFHVRRMLMLCNANLMDTAVGKKNSSLRMARSAACSSTATSVPRLSRGKSYAFSVANKAGHSIRFDYSQQRI